ncbi:sensor histidine kinase, partial [Thermosulfuriphilus sp.]
LTSVKLATDILIRKEGENNPQLFIIQKNTEKLANMINNLLDYAKIESGHVELNKKEGDLIELLYDVIFTVEPLAQAKEIRIVFKAPERPLIFAFDKERIFQVFLNLLANAVKFSPKGAPILLSIKDGPSSVTVSIEDFGPGIPEEEWPRIFEKFYRGSGTKSQGMGLGLAICWGIVKAHGGKIWLSKPPHEGIIFNVELPKRSIDG